jgi:hypothetical protein
MTQKLINCTAILHRLLNQYRSAAHGTPGHSAHIAGHAGLVQARIHDSHARRTHAYAGRAYADVTGHAGLVDARIPHPCVTDRAGLVDARIPYSRPGRADTNAGVNCNGRAGQGHAQGNDQGKVYDAAYWTMLQLGLHLFLSAECMVNNTGYCTT